MIMVKNSWFIIVVYFSFFSFTFCLLLYQNCSEVVVHKCVTICKNMNYSFRLFNFDQKRKMLLHLHLHLQHQNFLFFDQNVHQDYDKRKGGKVNRDYNRSGTGSGWYFFTREILSSTVLQNRILEHSDRYIA